MKATFKSIPNGVLNRLSKLTSIMDENSKTLINELCPSHTMALSKTGLSIKKVPTLKELWRNTDELERKKKEKREIKRGGRRNTFYLSNYHNYGRRE